LTQLKNKERYMELILALTGASLLYSLGFFYLRHQYMKKINALISEIEELKKESSQKKSQELTEFLADFKLHGYSFVRVDPGAVFMRSPREL
jgi:hypothetical protein